MNRAMILLRKKLLWLLILIFIGVAYFSSTGSSSIQSKQQDVVEQKRQDWELHKKRIRVEDLRVENKTKGITVVSLERDEDFLKLKLKNTSSKTITAYELGIGEMTIHTECLTGMDYNNVFYPGTTREERLAIQPGIDELGIRILAAIFEDGADDGDTKYIKEIRQYRSGMKMQRERSIALLQDLVNSNNESLATTLSKLENQLYKPTDENQLSFFTKGGLQDEQHRFLRVIDKLKAFKNKSSNGPQVQDYKEKINLIIANYRKTLPQL